MPCLVTRVQTGKSAQVDYAYQTDRVHSALSPVLRTQIAQGARRARVLQMAEAHVFLEMTQVVQADSATIVMSQLIVARGFVWMTARTFIAP